MKVLLIGPYPPPHGGISVHVSEAKKQLEQNGIPCRVLNITRDAPESDQYISIRGGLGLLFKLFEHANSGWTFHLHTNGHNKKSWLMAFGCGLMGQLAPACLLTIHSGMAPVYLGGAWRRIFARMACRLYDRIIAVNQQIRSAIVSLGIPAERLEELPAYLSAKPAGALTASVQELLQVSGPILTTVLFYRPEYGFDLLLDAVATLRKDYPDVRCLVMGSGEQRREAEQQIHEKDLQSNVILMGDVPHEVCLAIISASDLFVRPTLEDGDSISVREALSLGIPTVVSNVGTRPPGAVLFERGNVSDLLAKAESVLAGRQHQSSPAATRITAIGARRLIEIYRRVFLQGVQA